ncbi:hypothetical protein BS17DRAFT_672814, partial [Gyrodon lividus]
HVRTAFETCAVGITWFSCVREFLNAIIGAILAYQSAYEQRGILHCDISDTNIWIHIKKAVPEEAVPDWPTNAPSKWYSRCPGMAGDWGFTQDKNTKPTPDTVRFLTGTFPFQACEIINVYDEEKAPDHHVHHDLESFFWVVWLICLNVSGPYDQRVFW